MEELGLTPEQRQGMVDVYTHLQAALPEFDRQHADGAREVMAEALGGKAQLAPAIEDIDGYLRDGQRISPELAEGIMRARLPGGQRLLNHPVDGFRRWNAGDIENRWHDIDQMSELAAHAALVCDFRRP